MNKHILKNIFRALLWSIFLLPFSAQADIVYPARLELREIEPGIFEVYFVLPVINGQVLKAAPVFPEFCKNTTEPEVSGNAYIKEMRWVISCEPRELYGENIGISGLLGSQINIILQLNTLEGRSYTTTLNPAAAWFQVPYPPTTVDLIKNGVVKGARIPVTEIIFVLLVLTLALRRSFSGKMTVLVLSLGIISGFLLSYLEWLRAPGWMFELTALSLSFILILESCTSEKRITGKEHLTIPLITSLLFLGGGQHTASSLIGFTTTETAFIMLWTLLGIVLGVTLIYLLIRQGLYLLRLFQAKKFNPDQGVTILSGILVCGLLIYHFSLLWKTPSLFPPIPLILYVLGLMVLSGYLLYKNIPRGFLALYLLIPYLAGIWLGFTGFSVPYIPEITLAAGMLLLISLALGALSSGVVSAMLLLITGAGAGLYLAQYTDQYLSYPIARSVEFSSLLIFMISVAIPLTTLLPNRIKVFPSWITLPRVVFTMAVIMTGSILFTMAGFSFEGIRLSPELQPPLLSMGLLIAAILIWPRRKRIHKDLGVSRRKPIASLLLLGLSLCCLPVKTAINNPWFSTDNMNREQVEAIMQQVLSNTYNAFNIEDEERLFEALASNVDEQLLDNIYLDSRRRLTMGLREGAEVTVEDVNLKLTGDPGNRPGETAVSYPASWTVTARVKHLKHIHYRRNRYNGTIEMKTDNNSWKISKIILNSEEREVIQSANL